uniref:Ufm1-specific protease 1-like n=1 Tax=Salarias fasciatus TaxID=181472 RepID=A0A672GVL1_SALFA
SSFTEKAFTIQEIDWGGGGGGGGPEEGATSQEKLSLLKNVHSGLPDPLPHPVKRSVIEGDYLYFHYGCDGQDDRGWGCGYRTVQTLSSWLRMNGFPARGPAPTLPRIQQALVSMQDKPDSFRGSRDWIGTFEASLVLDFIHDVPCKLVHVRGGAAELERVAAEELHRHFHVHGSPVMMGGDRDNSSKGIVGVCTGAGGSHLLVVDPHYYGGPPERAELQRRGWVAWRRVSSLDQDSFYNLCMPQTARKST